MARDHSACHEVDSSMGLIGKSTSAHPQFATDNLSGRWHMKVLSNETRASFRKQMNESCHAAQRANNQERAVLVVHTQGRKFGILVPPHLHD